MLGPFNLRRTRPRTAYSSGGHGRGRYSGSTRCVISGGGKVTFRTSSDRGPWGALQDDRIGAERMTANREVMLTPTGRASLQERVDEIADVELPAMRPLLVEDERDERVVADFERLQAEHDRLVVLLGTSGTLDLLELGGQIALGSRVAFIDADGDRRIVRIVDPVEAYLDDERISYSSPLASALMGNSVGDDCQVEAPAGTWTAQIVEVGEDI